MIVKIRDNEYKLVFRKVCTRWLYEYYVILRPLDISKYERLEGYIGKINKKSNPFVAFFDKSDAIYRSTFNEIRSITKKILLQKYGD